MQRKHQKRVPGARNGHISRQDPRPLVGKVPKGSDTAQQVGQALVNHEIKNSGNLGICGYGFLCFKQVVTVKSLCPQEGQGQAGKAMPHFNCAHDASHTINPEGGLLVPGSQHSAPPSLPPRTILFQPFCSEPYGLWPAISADRQHSTHSNWEGPFP